MSNIIGKDNNKDSKLIIDISDIYEQRKRKEDELEFYNKELEKLMFRLGMVQQEIGVTNTIISMIENEQVLDLKQAIEQKRDR